MAPAPNRKAAPISPRSPRSKWLFPFQVPLGDHADNLSSLIDHERVGYAADAVILQRGAVQTDGVFHSGTLQEFVHRLVAFFDERQQLKVLLCVFAVKLCEVRDALNTRPAPRGPEFQQYTFPRKFANV